MDAFIVDLTKSILTTFIIVSWIAGLVVAQGFWSTTITCIVPPYAWYLIIELLIHNGGLI